MALAAVFVEGIIFLALSLTNVREQILQLYPDELKVCCIRRYRPVYLRSLVCRMAHIVVDSATLDGMYSFKASVANGMFSSEGITVLLALIGVLITGVLLVKGVKGNILWGILITWALGMYAS